MRYIISITGAAGFALVFGVGLWHGKPAEKVLLGALFAAVGFGLLARLWMGLLTQGLEDSLLTKQINAISEIDEPEEELPTKDGSMPAPNEQ